MILSTDGSPSGINSNLVISLLRSMLFPLRSWIKLAEFINDWILLVRSLFNNGLDTVYVEAVTKLGSFGPYRSWTSMISWMESPGGKTPGKMTSRSDLGDNSDSQKSPISPVLMNPKGSGAAKFNRGRGENPDAQARRFRYL